MRHRVSKLMVLAAFMMLLIGCATANVETVGKNGNTCKASYMSAFKDMQAIKMTACHASGEATGSTVDPLADALLNTLIKGMNR